MILIIDNYDSFTFNLYQFVGSINEDVLVKRNDKITVEEIAKLNPSHIILSPGPGYPKDAGICEEVLQNLKGRFPIMGVCLGHQAIGQAFGGEIIRAKKVMHGRLSDMHHSNKGIFSNLPSPFSATRYHSLVIDQESLPECLEVTCWTNEADGSIEEIMGVKHKTLAVEGVQFHPESILSQHGHQIFKNFLEIYA